MTDLLHSESFWVSIAFFIFVILSFKKGKEFIISALDKRIANIKNSINESKKIKLDAENNLKEVEINFKKLKIDKKEILVEAKKKAQIIKEEILVQERINNERLNKQISERIEQSKNEIIKNIKNLSTEISIKSIKELLKSQKNDLQEKDLITKSIIKLFKKKENGKNHKEL